MQIQTLDSLQKNLLISKKDVNGIESESETSNRIESESETYMEKIRIEWRREKKKSYNHPEDMQIEKQDAMRFGNAIDGLMDAQHTKVLR